MPWHVALDGARERRLGKLEIGTTRRGDRPRLRRQGDPDRDPRPGPARPQDPAPEDRGRAGREERLAREGLRDRAGRRSRPSTSASTSSTHSGFARTSPTPRCSSTARCARARRCCSRARRGPSSTSTTARTRSSPRRTRSPATPRSPSGSARSDRRDGRRHQGLRHPGRRRAFPSEIEGPARSGCGSWSRGRHGDRPRAALRLARPRRAPLAVRSTGSPPSR